MTSSSEASVPSGAARAGASPSTRLFVRQTSGLVRDLGIPAATGISLASVAVVVLAELRMRRVIGLGMAVAVLLWTPPPRAW